MAPPFVIVNNWGCGRNAAAGGENPASERIRYDGRLGHDAWNVASECVCGHRYGARPFGMRWFDAACRPGGSSNRGREPHRNRHGDADPEIPARLPPRERPCAEVGAATRRPAYVNPTNDLLDIYVDGVLVTGLGGPSGHSLAIAPNPDGTQTIAGIPPYSSSTDIAVVEWDASATVILAVGENPSISVTAGGAANVTLTMQMNATDSRSRRMPTVRRRRRLPGKPTTSPSPELRHRSTSTRPTRSAAIPRRRRPEPTAACRRTSRSRARRRTAPGSGSSRSARTCSVTRRAGAPSSSARRRRTPPTPAVSRTSPSRPA